MMKNAILCVLLALMLGACANIPSTFKFDPASDDGLIVGTITYDSSIGLYALAVSPPAGGTQPKIDVGYSMAPPLGPLYDDLLKARGGTFAVPARAGTYTIRAWVVRQGYKVSRSETPIDIPFVVEKGKASYIGNLHFSEHWEVSLRDRSDRDFQALQTRYEVLRSAPIAYTIAKGTELQGLGGTYRSQIQMPATIFIPMGR